MFLTAFTAGLVLITISELGDKTFFITLCLAMRYPRRWVFAGAITALAAMTILSVLLGLTAALMPQQMTFYGSIALFLGFGLKLLYDASRMPVGLSGPTTLEAEQDALETVSGKPSRWGCNPGRIFTQTFAMTFLAEWGDRTQFATINLAVAQDPWGVTTGSVLGHAICAAIAVMGGRLVAGRLSERLLTTLGGCLFLLFAAVTWFEGAVHP
jgi:putative Ca2+/H+ antiporter (TMEM165/GDT1 family)